MCSPNRLKQHVKKFKKRAGNFCQSSEALLRSFLISWKISQNAEMRLYRIANTADFLILCTQMNPLTAILQTVSWDQFLEKKKLLLPFPCAQVRRF